MASVLQTAINKAAGLEGKTEKERERLLRLAHARKSRGLVGSVKKTGDDAPDQEPGEDGSQFALSSH